MKKQFFPFFAFFALGIFLAGCDQEKSVGETRNGQPHGEWKYWYANGQREKTGTYADGVMTGQWTYWYESGQRKESGAYLVGKRDGQWQTWYEDGQLHETGKYENDLKQGEWLTFYPNGQIASRTEFAEGNPKGTLLAWDTDGQKKKTSSVTDKDIEELIAGLREPSPAVASEASSRLKNRGAAAVPALLDVLRESDVKLRLRAIMVIKDIGTELLKEADKAIPVLVDTLGDKDYTIALLASNSLASIGPPAVPALTDALERPVSQVRRLSAQALATMGPAALPALPNLVKALREPSARENSGKALAGIGKPAVADLTEALSDPAAEVRITAAISLGQIGTDAQEATAALIAALDYTDKNLDRVVVDALGNIGPTAIPLLIEALQQESAKEQVLKNTASALAAIGEPSVEPLIPLLKNPSSNTRRHAATALEQLGPTAKAALPALEEAMKSEKDTSVSFYLRSAQLKINQ